MGAVVLVCSVTAFDIVFTANFGSFALELLLCDSARRQFLAEEHEWSKLTHSLRQPLPVAFRVSTKAQERLEIFKQDDDDGNKSVAKPECQHGQAYFGQACPHV